MGCSEMRSEIPNESEVLIYFKWIFRIFQVKIGYINVWFIEKNKILI